MATSPIAGTGEVKSTPALDALDDRASAAIDAELSSLPAGAPAVPESPSAPPEPPVAAVPPPADPSAPQVAPAAATTSASPNQYSAEAINLIAKYGGRVDDPASVQAALDKAAKSYWELARQNAESARASKQEAQVASPATPAPVLASQEVQQLDANLQALTEEYKGLDREYTSAVKAVETQEAEVGAIRERLSDLQQEILSADLATDEAKLKADARREIQRLRAAENKLNGARNAANGILDRARQLQVHYRNTEAVRANALRLDTLYKAREAELEQRKAEQVDSFSYEWDNAVANAAANPASIIPENLRPRFTQWAKAQALWYVQTPGPDGGRRIIEDTGAYAGQLAKEFLNDLQEYHRAQSAVYSQQKAADSQIAAPPAGKAATTPEKRKRSVADWDTIHNDAVL